MTVCVSASLFRSLTFCACFAHTCASRAERAKFQQQLQVLERDWRRTKKAAAAAEEEEVEQ